MPSKMEPAESCRRWNLLMTKSVYQELLISVVRMQYEMNPQMDKAPYLRFEKAANASRYQDLTPRRMTAGIADDSLQHGFGRSDEETDENYRYLYEQLTGLEEIEILSRPLDSGGDYVPFGLTLLAEGSGRALPPSGGTECHSGDSVAPAGGIL